MQDDLIPLHLLREGKHAEVAEIVGVPEQVQRVQEMGFRQGVELEMVRHGSPCIVRIGGQSLCLRGNEMLNVLVRMRAAS
jgi:ferrous iron transport protein A